MTDAAAQSSDRAAGGTAQSAAAHDAGRPACDAPGRPVSGKTLPHGPTGGEAGSDRAAPESAAPERAASRGTGPHSPAAGGGAASRRAAPDETAPARAAPQGPAPDWTAAGFGVYVHWPFCAAKCPYCDFNSHVARATPDAGRWAAALTAELRAARALTGPRPADTVFFGGGTPSLMEPATVAAVLRAVDDLWGLAPGAEVTLEANPTSVEAARFAGYAAAGVNRVSMGAQALNDADLKALGRMHSVAEARAAFAVARAAFARVSFDLIYAREGQTVADWAAELRAALDMAADHLSLYQLTIEPGTRFFDLHARGRLRPPDDDAAAEMYEVTQEICAAAGLPAYEVSNHARPGAESRHNLIYWRGGDWVGVGPGAHGRITAGGARLATVATADPAGWLAAVETTGHALATEELAGDAHADEYLLMALRLTEGADLDRFARLSGRRIDPARIAPLVADGLLAQRGARLAATARGRPLLNALLRALLA